MKNTFIKIAAVFILFQGMFLYTNFSIVLNELIAVYKIHQDKYGDDFTTFLSKHFGDLKEQHKKQHQQEHQEHKHNHEMNLTLHIDMLWNNSCDYTTVLNVVFYKNNNFIYKDLFSTFEKPKIFQPPRIA